MDVQVLNVRGLEQDVIVHGVISRVRLSACGGAAFGAEALDGLQCDAGLLLVDREEDALVPDVLVRDEADVRADELARCRHLTRTGGREGGVAEGRGCRRSPGLPTQRGANALCCCCCSSLLSEITRACVCVRCRCGCVCVHE